MSLKEHSRQNQQYLLVTWKMYLQLLLELQELSAGDSQSFIPTPKINYFSICYGTSSIAQCCITSQKNFQNPCYFLEGVFIRLTGVFESRWGPLERLVTAFYH